MTLRIRRLLLFTIGLGVAGGAALAMRTPPVPVEVAKAGHGPMSVVVAWTGKTRVRDRYQVAAPVSGQLMRIPLRAGDSVRAGDVVARITGAAASPLDPRSRAELAARLEAARAAETEARAAVQRADEAAGQARRDAARAEILSREGGLARQALDAAVAESRVRDEERRMADAALQRAKAEVGVAEAALGSGGGAASTVTVRSPIGGAVLRVLRESAGPVAAGMPLLELGDPSKLEVVLDLPTADAVQVHPGDAAVASASGGDATLRAVVRRVEPSAYTKVSPLGVEEQRVDVLLDPVGTGWGALGDGFAVDVQIVVQDLPQVLRVPPSALFRDRDGWALYAIEGDRVRRRVVEVLARGDGVTAIRGDVRPGDRVVVHPGDEVTEGVRVREADATTP
jgi:HlyD family secretion protein